MYGERPQLGTMDLGRLSRIAAAAFGDVPMRGCMGLGYDWTDYLKNGNGPPNGSVTSPNGDVLTFDDTGGPDKLFPHAGSGLDADVDKDPASSFYGWSNREKAAYGAATGVQGVATDQIRAGAVYDPDKKQWTIPQGVIDASQAQLVKEAYANPKVAQALKDNAAGIHQGINDPATLAATAARVKADAEAQAAYNAAMMAWYAAGHTGPYPGYNPAMPITNTAATGALSPPGPARLAPPESATPVVRFDPAGGSGPYLVPAVPSHLVPVVPSPIPLNARDDDTPEVAIETVHQSDASTGFNWFPIVAAAVGGGLLLAGANRRRGRR